jgi:hypothetical protein
LVSFFPLDARGWIDLEITTDVTAPLDHIRQHTLDTTQKVISALERGSAYHQYQNPASQPCLKYSVVGNIEYFTAMPLSQKMGWRNTPFPDYNAIMHRIGVREWVEKRGVKEIWIWGYHGSKMELWESNMASRWGDISNSDRDPHDLPVLSKTYTVYHYNYQRGESEATEDHMHQIEALLRHQSEDLFWNRFVGKVGEGRCGWTHFPPNGVRDYDWANPQYVWTDIEDWRPEGGGKKIFINSDRWNRDSLTWFIYWMQNLPGANNGLTYRGKRLSNWWQFIGDFDAAMSQSRGLVA